MTTQWLFVGVPLLVFAIVDSFGGQKKALISAILFALAEFVFSYFLIGEIDWTSFVTLGIVVGLAAVSLIKKDSIHFKMQPAIMALILGVFLLGLHFLQKPFLYEMLVKYKSLMPEDRQWVIELEHTKLLSKWFTFYSGILFSLLAVIMYWIAKNCSNLIWILGRMIGTLACAGLGGLLAHLHINS